MIIYEALKKEFVKDVKDDILIQKLYDKYQEKIGKTSLNEIRSWNNSLEHMRNIVDDENIPDDSGVAIEFNIPYTSKRVDFILSGQNENHEDTAIIVELKQWDMIEVVKNKDAVVKTYLGGSIRETTHPSYQAYTYAKMIEDYNEVVQDENIKLNPCVYMHNYIRHENDPIESTIYKFYILKSPIFMQGEARSLRNFITKTIKYGDKKETLYKIDGGRLRPSKSLQDCLLKMLEGNQEFLMIDEQKLVYEKALELGRKSYRDLQKRVLIVNGGPGTGKSVLAINLLVKMTAKDAACIYVTKNSAPRSVYQKKLKSKFKQAVIAELFKGSGSFCNVKSNIYDVILCDEAHRLNAKSGMFKNLAENQVKEIINASKFSVFFIDEHQKIHIDDIGTVSEIEKWAKFYGAEVTRMELVSQFRCNGSDGFLAWLDNALQIRKTANFDGFENYDFKIIDSPNELARMIKEKNKISNKARLVAGYCWDWVNDGKNNPDIYDINIADFHASWNLGNTSTWAIDENSVDQIGCIHTCQGLEFDYVGVIIGDDITVDPNENIITNWRNRASTDQSIKGLKSLAKIDPKRTNEIGDQIIKNTYRTLMTRGQKGCYIYCTNKNFADYLRKCLNRGKINGQ